MTARILWLASLLPLSALAQLQVFQFDGTNYTPVAAVANVGSASPGDTLRARFRLRNMGNGPAILQTLSLSGEGFSIQIGAFDSLHACALRGPAIGSRN